MSGNILFEIKKLDQLIFQNLMKGKDFSKNPSPTQMRIMGYMIEHQDEDVYQKDLENHLNISRATISDVLNTMEKNNLVTRKSDEIDTRTKKVILSDEAKKLNNEAKKEVDNLINTMTKNISDNDIEIFRKVIKLMEENLSSTAK